MDGEAAPTHYRSVFISDIHLGTRGCQSEMLLDFLRQMSCERLFLIGDIVDGWAMKKGWFWPQSHNDVVQKLLRLARKGVAVTYIPGNHDDRVRDFCGVHFGGVLVARDAIHQTADGRRFLVLHGDEFDGSVRHGPVSALAGHLTYKAVLGLNTAINVARRRLGIGSWSLAAFLKSRVDKARRFVDNFERAAAVEARRRGVDGIICGHIHKAELRPIDGVIYANDGDWVESCTALVEQADGSLEILRWAQARSWSMIEGERRRESPPLTLPEPSLA